MMMWIRNLQQRAALVRLAMVKWKSDFKLFFAAVPEYQTIDCWQR